MGIYEGFSASDDHEVGIVFLDGFEDFIEGIIGAGGCVPGIFCIAPFASQWAAGKPDEYARHACEQSFAL